MGAGVTKEQRRLLTEYNAFLRTQIGQPGPQYEGDIAPGASELQERSFDLARDFAGPNQVDPALARLLAGETGYVADTGESERFFQANVAKPLTREYDRSLDAIDQRLAVRGLGDSGVRARAFTDVNRNFTDSLERGRSEFAYKDRQNLLNSRESALDRLSQGISQSLGLDLSRMAVVGGAGDLQRSITGQQNQDAYRRFLEAQPIYNPALQLIGGPIQQPTAGGAPGNGTWVDGLLGAANSLLNPASMIGGGAGGGAGGFFG